jgi:hypothetical protein
MVTERLPRLIDVAISLMLDGIRLNNP